MLSDEKSKLSMKEIMLRGSIIAAIITVPSLVTFVLVWTLFNDLLFGAILGVVIHFVAMGFSLKISKKILVKK